MESTSLPLMIHITHTFKNILDKLDGYETVERGVIPVKGKGDLKTFWLISESEERMARRKLGVISESNSKNMITEVLFPRKPRRNFTPEFRSRQNTADTIRCSPNNIKRSSSTGKEDERSRRNVYLLLNKTRNKLSMPGSNNGSNTWFDNVLYELKPANSQSSLNVSLVTPSSPSKTIYTENVLRTPSHLNIVTQDFEETQQLSTNVNGPNIPHISLSILSIENNVSELNSIVQDNVSGTFKGSLRELFFNRFGTNNQRKISRSESVPFLRETFPLSSPQKTADTK